MTKKLLFIPAILCIVVFAFCACAPFGIPRGTYYPCDKDGNIKQTAIEATWRVGRNSAIYGYAEYEIIIEKDKTYFASDIGGKYERKIPFHYDNDSKILIVTMPKDSVYQPPAYEIIDEEAGLWNFFFKIDQE